jgi:dihydrofolate reductase
MGKVALFIACSIDGYIAKPGDNLDFLKTVEREGEDYGYETFNREMDVLVIGRKTYDYVVSAIGPEHYDNGKRDVYVLTRTPKASEGRTIFYSGDVANLVTTLKRSMNVYCDGGAEVINTLMKHDLIDEITVSLVPVVLGDGVRLFQRGLPESDWLLRSSRSYESGLVQMSWTKKKGK